MTLPPYIGRAERKARLSELEAECEKAWPDAEVWKHWSRIGRSAVWTVVMFDPHRLRTCLRVLFDMRRQKYIVSIGAQWEDNRVVVQGSTLESAMAWMLIHRWHIDLVINTANFGRRTP